MALLGHYWQYFDQRQAGPRLCRSVLFKILAPLHARRVPPAFDTQNCFDDFWQSPQPEKPMGDSVLAQRMYRGIFEFADEKVIATPAQLFQQAMGGPDWTTALLSFDWLQHFATRPKKLGACYAASLMEAWNGTTARLQDIEQESTRLLNMQSSLPVLAQHVELPMRQILMQSLRIQTERLKQVKPDNIAEGAHQALTLARAALVLQHPGQNLTAGLMRLDAALAKSSHADGGPVSSGIAQHLRLLQNLRQLEKVLQLREMTLSPVSAQARDRIASFLDMFQRSDGSFAFNLQNCQQNGTAPLRACDIQRVAAKSGTVRLCHGRSVLIAANGAGFAAPCVDISVGKSPLLSFGALQFSGHVTATRTIEDAQGSALATGQRQIFMASSGDDIRIQEELDANSSSEPLALTFHPNIKISLARHSGRVSLAMPDRTHWQLSIRGGHFEPCNSDHQLLLIPEPGHGGTLNWAIKRVVEDQSSKPARSAKNSPSPPELLF